jgi:hypothetical protein
MIDGYLLFFHLAYLLEDAEEVQPEFFYCGDVHALIG